MEYKILEANGVENENVDGAGFNNFCAGNKDLIIKGVLNECNIVATNLNTITIDTGELLIKGFRFKITSPYSHSFSSVAATPTNYEIIARITLLADRTVNGEIICRTPQELVQNNLFASETGTYESVVATFIHTVDGISNIVSILQKESSGETITVDAELSTESTNAVQNKVVTEELNGKLPYFTEWNAETTYKKGDIVYKKASKYPWYLNNAQPYQTFMSLVDDNIGNTLPNGDGGFDNSYWSGSLAPLPNFPQFMGSPPQWVLCYQGDGQTAKYFGLRQTNIAKSGKPASLNTAPMVTDANGNTFIGLNPTHDQHATPKKFVEDLVATKTLYLHEYTLIGTVANENGSYVYVKILTNQDTAYTSVTDLWAEYEKIVSVRFAYVSNTIVVPEQIGFDYINIRYVNGSGVFDETVDITTFSIYSQTITQLN